MTTDAVTYETVSHFARHPDGLRALIGAVFGNAAELADYLEDHEPEVSKRLWKGCPFDAMVRTWVERDDGHAADHRVVVARLVAAFPSIAANLHARDKAAGTTYGPSVRLR